MPASNGGCSDQRTVIKAGRLLQTTPQQLMANGDARRGPPTRRGLTAARAPVCQVIRQGTQGVLKKYCIVTPPQIRRPAMSASDRTRFRLYSVMRSAGRQMLSVGLAFISGCASGAGSSFTVTPELCGLYGANPPWNSTASPPSDADELIALAALGGITPALGSRAYWFSNASNGVALCYHESRPHEACGASSVTFERIDGKWHAGPLGLVVC